MRRRSRLAALGAVVLGLTPLAAGAQGGGSTPITVPGGIAMPSPSPRPLIGFGSLGEAPRHEGTRGTHQPFDRSGFLLRQSGVGLLAGSSWVEPFAVPVPTPVPYPVPYYYPARVRRAPEPTPPAKPYNAADSKTLFIGEGADGGAGVMRIERSGTDSLRLTWRGSVRPVREARFFLADSSQRPLASRTVHADAPTAVFAIGALEAAVAYTGLTVIYADGATVTNLVPHRPVMR